MSQKEYLWSPTELAQKGVELGDFKDGTTYDEFMERATSIARRRGFESALLGLALNFMPGHPMGLTEYTYPISRDEWDTFLKDRDLYCSEMPKVYVVDGGKYRLPI